MKIELAKPKFQPITIILETEGEAALMREILGGAAGNHENDMVYKIWSVLSSVSTKARHYERTSGTVGVVEV